VKWNRGTLGEGTAFTPDRIDLSGPVNDPERAARVVGP